MRDRRKNYPRCACSEYQSQFRIDIDATTLSLSLSLSPQLGLVYPEKDTRAKSAERDRFDRFASASRLSKPKVAVISLEARRF